jgi:hypothetical protein
MPLLPLFAIVLLVTVIVSSLNMPMPELFAIVLLVTVIMSKLRIPSPPASAFAIVLPVTVIVPLSLIAARPPPVAIVQPVMVTVPVFLMLSPPPLLMQFVNDIAEELLPVPPISPLKIAQVTPPVNVASSIAAVPTWFQNASSPPVSAKVRPESLTVAPPSTAIGAAVLMVMKLLRGPWITSAPADSSSTKLLDKVIVQEPVVAL